MSLIILWFAVSTICLIFTCIFAYKDSKTELGIDKGDLIFSIVISIIPFLNIVALASFIAVTVNKK